MTEGQGGSEVLSGEGKLEEPRGLGRLGKIGERLGKLTQEGWLGFLRDAVEGKKEAVETLVGKEEKPKGGEK